MNAKFKEIFYSLVGSAISAKRKENNLSQLELATKVGMSRVSIVNIEKGRQYPPLILVYELTDIFKCSMDDLIPEKEQLTLSEETKPFFSKRMQKAKKRGDIPEESLSKINSFINKD